MREALRWPGGRLTADGAAVAVADIRLEATADIVGTIENEGGRALAVEVDVTSEESVEAGAAAAVEAFGGLDGVLATAGAGWIHELEDEQSRFSGQIIEDLPDSTSDVVLLIDPINQNGQWTGT